MVKIVGIVHNAQKQSAVEVARRTLNAFERGGAQVKLRPDLINALGLDSSYASDDFEECDLLTVLGGDGTLLSTLDVAIRLDIPILGINLGHIGFLTEIQTDEIEREIDSLMRGESFLEERMLLLVEIPGMKPAHALNDIAFNRADCGMGIVHLCVESDGVLIDRYAGDGLVIASATGSTAYSMSAGGPIVMPGMDCMLLTPICAHTLTARPVVMAATASLEVRAIGGKPVSIQLDGRMMCVLDESSGPVIVKKAEQRVRFLRMRKRNYFDLLRAKLSEWTNEAGK